MSVQTVDVGLDDKELFADAVAPEPAEKPEPEAKADEGQPRDEHGRFAPKQAAEEPKAEPEPVAEQPKAQEPKDEAHVPSWRLREVSEARQAAEARAQQAEQQRYQLQAQFEQMQRQLAELRAPKQEPVDFFQNPDAALAQRVDPIQQQFHKLQAETRLANSKAIAIAVHGKPAIDEMEGAINQAMASGHPEMPLLAAQMQASNDPVDVAMKWHQRTKLQQETGGDLTKYREKLMSDALKDPQFLAKAIEAAKAAAGQNPSPNVQIPVSLNKALGSGGNSASESEAESMSDRSLFRDAVSKRR